MRYLLPSTLLACAAGLTTISAFAQSGHAPAAPTPAAHAAEAAQLPADDPNSPVQIHRREQYIDEAFKRVDTNHDGVIDPREFRVYLERYLDNQRKVFDEDFAAADKNKDGRISRAEAKAANYDVYVHFKDIDTNGDGYLSKEELIDFIRERNRRQLVDGGN